MHLIPLEKTQDRTKPSFHNNYSYLKKLDTLPTGPDWTCDIIMATGDRVGENGVAMVEELELWRHDSVDCIQELIGNPAFKECLTYIPERIYCDQEGMDHVYDEMWTADWWWQTQVCLISCHQKLNSVTVEFFRNTYQRERLLHPLF